MECDRSRLAEAIRTLLELGFVVDYTTVYGLSIFKEEDEDNNDSYTIQFIPFDDKKFAFESFTNQQEAIDLYIQKYEFGELYHKSNL